MKTFFSKLKGAFGDKSIAKPQDPSFIENIINDVDGAPFAISETNVLYAGLSELAGYHYFKTITIGTFQIKTFNGAKLIINGKDFKLELHSDMVELASESTKMANRNITRIDFEIHEEDIPKISRTSVESIELIAKKNHVKFLIVEGNFDEELSNEGAIHEEPTNEEATHKTSINEELDTMESANEVKTHERE